MYINRLRNIHIHAYIYICTYIYLSLHIYIYIYICVYINMCIYNYFVFIRYRPQPGIYEERPTPAPMFGFRPDLVVQIWLTGPG